MLVCCTIKQTAPNFFCFNLFLPAFVEYGLTGHIFGHQLVFTPSGLPGSNYLFNKRVNDVPNFRPALFSFLPKRKRVFTIIAKAWAACVLVKLVESKSDTVLLKLGGHLSGVPNDVFDQLYPRIKPPISPQPCRK